MLTHANYTLSRSNFMRIVDLTSEYPVSPVMQDENPQFWDSLYVYRELDPLDQRLHDFVNSLKIETYHSYNNEQLTTIAYKYHQTISTDWIILMFNDLDSKLDLKQGNLLAIPSIVSIKNYLYKLPKVYPSSQRI
jgi:hypothetical protein